MRLWLVRHAAPVVAPGLCYGRLDVAADPTATAAAAQALRRALPPRWAGWHSGLQRARALAQALGAPPLADWRLDARLDEIDFGAWEGLPWDAVGPGALDAWVANFAHHRPGAGESVADLLRRVHAALHEVRALHPEGDVVWITHAGVIRAVQWLLEHGPAAPRRAEQWPAQAPGWGQWRIVALPGLGIFP
ncbi:histidine phosphatase family protein [Tepidimonas aquatica]|uniref:Putative phosphoserine phosphatase 2 n=1 Tax=Tepidimonas aquatica TaxID=247482 RepID=A0A554WN14_9BURK|nr:histidine phosphatase family protein [Tepidimonas aquatica]TSE24964.1 putative phosphoserine phosphatase 2 [Tepidimonas aquatica]